MNEERDSIRLLVTQSLIALCRSQLDYKQELSVDALVAITIDHKEVIVINVKDSLDFNPLSTTTHPCMRTPQLYPSRSPAYFPSPFQNESASDLDESLHENNCINENHDIIENTISLDKPQDLSIESHKVIDTQNAEKNSDDNKTTYNDIFQDDIDLQAGSPQLTIIAPSGSVHDEDLLTTDDTYDGCREEVVRSTEDLTTKIQNSTLNVFTHNTFPRISLKSFSPTHIKNKIRLHFNKGALNNNSNNTLNHGFSLSNGALNKKIILNSSLTSSQLINNHNNEIYCPSTTLVTTAEASSILSGPQFLNYCSNSDVNTNTTSTDNLRVLSLAPDKEDQSKKTSMGWSDFQSMLIKSLRRNHQEELDVKPQLMHYIQAWTETTDSNSHKRMRECMQAILLYEGRYVPVRDIQRLRLSGMTSQEIRSSMEFLNSIREGRIGCYREIRGCIGVFYKCPPHLIDIQWLTLFGLNQQIYAIKFASQMPLNATNRHSAVYWDRIHFSSPYIPSTHSPPQHRDIPALCNI